METTPPADILVPPVQDFDRITGPEASDTIPLDILDLLESIVHFLSIYYTLVLVVTGCICNSLAIAVLSRPAFRGTSMALYFRFLSLMDLAAILTGLTRFFQISAFGFDVRKETISCRVNFWIMNVFLFSSSWTLIAVTTERVLSIIKPHKVRLICSTKRINHIIIGIFICMAAINTPIFYILGTLEETSPMTNMTVVRYCTVVVERDTVRMLFWWYESTMFAFIPCVILLVFNVIILKGVIDSRKNIKSMTSSNSVVADLETKKDKNDNKSKPRNKVSSLTVTLLCINATFIVCNFPICVYQITPLAMDEWQISRISIIMVHFFLMLMYTNNALNFLLYCITGSKFRTELIAMISEIVSQMTCNKTVK